MKTIKWLLPVLCCITLLTGCRALKEPVVIGNISADTYKYAYITPIGEKKSSVGSIYNNLNPADVISGSLIKQGFIILPELKPNLINKTLIVSYGESGRRPKGGFGGYTIEVSIQFTSAKTNEIICTCTAEGQGMTETDDVRIAILRAMNALFNESK